MQRLLSVPDLLPEGKYLWASDWIQAHQREGHPGPNLLALVSVLDESVYPIAPKLTIAF